MSISKLPTQHEKITIRENKYFYNAFIDLARRYKKTSTKENLKDFIIKNFLQERWKITNQHTISNKKWLKKANFWNVNFLPIYDYSFHIIFKNENDGILTFFYSPDNYNQYEKVYHSFKEIGEAINDLANQKWKFQLIIQKWNKINNPSPVNNTKYKLTEILAA